MFRMSVILSETFISQIVNKPLSANDINEASEDVIKYLLRSNYKRIDYSNFHRCALLQSSEITIMTSVLGK